jgi:glycosyltransferase involved in cell wall biosynthesis
MLEHLSGSYKGIEDRIEVVPQPPPDWALHINADRGTSDTDEFRLFYPAAGYPHKNHRVLHSIAESLARSCIDIKPRILITLDRETASRHSFPDIVENLGHLSSDSVQQVYRDCDGLFFPSLLESLGLPLVEAICAGLPIVCSDLPYARWLCGDQAVYFDPLDPSDACRAINELHKKITSGWRPDYTQARSKFPGTWGEVADSFERLLRNA